MKLNIIYKPKGRAKEYAPLALDIYGGCGHKCKYCYVTTSGKNELDSYFDEAAPQKDVVSRVERDLIKLAAAGNTEEVLLSFRGDVYQPADVELGLTRKIVELFIKYNQPFTILTKGGVRARRDFDLVIGYPKFRFGTTLVFMNQAMADEWEPGADSIESRIRTIEIAKAAGIPTWVSIEPVIDTTQAFMLVDELYEIVDFWKIGKINYHPEIEDKIDWIKFREQMKTLMEVLGCDYYLKKSLTEL